MCSVMVHRGPDDEGIHTGPGVGLGMRRLSIIDLAGGRQPMRNESGTVHVVANGEIYNFRELRRDLEARGHRFRSDSDTETIVHLYEQYGVDCVQHLRGMFGLAVWDSRRRQLMLARDRLGGQRWRHHHHQGVVLALDGFGEHRLLFGRTIAPRTRSAMRWMLRTRPSQHGCSVVNVATCSTMSRSAACSVVSSGGTTCPSSTAVRGPGEVAKSSSCAAARRASKRNPSSAGTTCARAPSTVNVASVAGWFSAAPPEPGAPALASLSYSRIVREALPLGIAIFLSIGYTRVAVFLLEYRLGALADGVAHRLRGRRRARRP